MKSVGVNMRAQQSKIQSKGRRFRSTRRKSGSGEGGSGSKGRSKAVQTKGRKRPTEKGIEKKGVHVYLHSTRTGIDSLPPGACGLILVTGYIISVRL